MKSRKWARRRSHCKPCYDGVYPFYGMAPHESKLMWQRGFIDSGFIPREHWPSNFEPDPEQEKDFIEKGILISQGVWYCPKCGKK